MCGSCGTYSVKDWSWPWLAQSRSATLVARAAERLSRIRGIRILPSPDGWQVHMPTGATQLVHSVTALARLAQVDSTAAPEVSLAVSDEIPIVDRRRMIAVRAAQFPETPTAESSIWPDDLMRPETTVITIKSSHSIRLLQALEELANTASAAPFRDHIRLRPIASDLMRTVTVHRWTDFPETIGTGDIPALYLSLAARLVSLPQTDSKFREARVRCGVNGMVQIQSVGPTITAMDVQPS